MYVTQLMGVQLWTSPPPLLSMVSLVMTMVIWILECVLSTLMYEAIHVYSVLVLV